jgi:hypothetical protein
VSRRRTGALADYCGAVGRLDISKVVRLSPRDWAIQPKEDGMYIHLTTDERGRVANVLSRSGTVLPRSQVGHLIGQRVNAPHACLAGELLQHTERGNAERDRLGYSPVRLFDLIRTCGRYVGRLPYRERRDLLRKGETWAIDQSAPLPYKLERDGHARDKRSGRFCEARPTDWRLCSVVEQYAPARAGELWEQAMAGVAEGLVAVNLTAPIGRRGAKRKAKPVFDLSAVVLSVDRTGAVLRILGRETIFAVGVSATAAEISPGDIADIEHEGWHGTGVPRFARLVRVRPDLMEGVAV